MHAEVSQDLLHVLHGESSHRNFGRHIPRTWNMWPCGTTASHFKRVGIMQQTLDFTYKQTRAFEVAIEVFQCSRRPCFFSLHALALTKVQFKKCQPIATQNVTINWSEMMRRMNYRINVVFFLIFGILFCCRNSVLDCCTIQSPGKGNERTVLLASPQATK